MDIGFARIFIIVVCFLGVTALLISFFAADGRWVTSQDVRLNDVPTEWNGINLRNLNLTGSWNRTLDGGNGLGEDFSIGGRNLWLQYHRTLNFIKVFHKAGTGLLFFETMRWYNERGEERTYGSSQWGLDKADLDEDFTDFNKLQYTVKSDWPFQIISLFFFNQSTYDTPSSAWDGSELQIFFGITWEYMSTTYSAWDIVGMMLFFQMPNTNPYINALIAIPIWAAIALFAAIIVLEFINAIKPFG